MDEKKRLLNQSSTKSIPPIQPLNFENEILCTDEIVTEGYLQKQSAFFGTFRNRWCVLKGKQLYAYRNKNDQKNPTEIFDLSVWNHLKSDKNKFILIASNQSQQRTFITESIFEIESWTDSIVNIQNKIKRNQLLQYQQVNNECFNINDCDCVKRIEILLPIHIACITNKYYLSLTDIVNRIFDNKYNITRILNDYIHILYSHTTSLHNIYDIFKIDCTIDKCIANKRNQRDRLKDHQQYNKSLFPTENDILLVDILDEIHCYLLHTFDLGYRLTEREKLEMRQYQSRNDDEDTQFVKLNEIIKRKRDRSNDDHSKKTHSKFVTMTITESKKDEIKEQDLQYSFSYRFNYWMPNHSLYVSQKYNGFKDEMLHNQIFHINISKWNYVQRNSKMLLDTNHCKHILANIDDGMKGCNIRIINGQSLELLNIMAVKFYTDCDTLQYEFSKSFRKQNMKETLEKLIERHQNFYWFARIIRETVECFGNYCCPKTKYYHGISVPMIFACTIAKFHHPTSTTENAVVAGQFATNNGIIIELSPAYHKVRCFKCKWISCFANEEESLFVGGYSSLKIENIFHCLQMKSYRKYLHCLNELIKCLYGMAADDATKRDTDILDILVNDWNHNSAMGIPSYFVKIFKAFARQTKKIKIDIDNVVEGQKSEYFLSLLLTNKREFINLDIISKIFVNLKEIELYNYDNISLNPLYFETIMKILQRNKLKSLELIIIKWVKFSLRHRNFFNETTQTKFEKNTGFQMNVLHETGLGHHDLMPQYLQLKKCN